MPAAFNLAHPGDPPPPPPRRAFASSSPPDRAGELAELFTRYAPYVARIGFKLLGRDEDLDDLVQDVFVEAHRGLAQLRTPDAAKGWLARITVRRAVRRLRRRRLRAFFSLEAVPEHAALIDGAATPEENAHVAAIYRRLDALPAALRVAWVLRHVEGETLDEIAVSCACSKATVQRRLRAAQRTLGEDKT